MFQVKSLNRNNWNYAFKAICFQDDALDGRRNVDGYTPVRSRFYDGSHGDDQCQYDVSAKRGVYLNSEVWEKSNPPSSSWRRGRITGWQNDAYPYDTGGNSNDIQVQWENKHSWKWAHPQDVLVSKSRGTNIAVNSNGGAPYEPTSGEPFFNHQSDGRHFGGVICAVAGMEQKCVQYRTGLGVLQEDDGVNSWNSNARCSAWAGGYLDHEQVIGDDLRPWRFLTSKYVQRDQYRGSNVDAPGLPMCTEPPSAARVSKSLIEKVKEREAPSTGTL